MDTGQSSEASRSIGRGGLARNPSVGGGRRGRGGQVVSGSSVGGDRCRDDHGGDPPLDPNVGGSGSDSMRVERTLLLNYHFDSNTGSGNLDEMDLPLFVDVHRRHPYHFPSSAIVHKNFLPILVYDTYADSNDNPSTNSLYHKFTKDLRSYVIEEPPALVSTYCIPSHGCKEQKIKCTYVVEPYRRFFRGIIKFIVFLHHRWNLSLAALNLDQNFVVHEGILKLCRLEFVECTSKSRTTDFTLLALVLRELFGLGGQMPIEAEHLCECMCAYKDDYVGQYNPDTNQGDHVLLVNHLAVLTVNKRVALIKNFFEKAEFADRDRYENVFLEMSYDLDWTRRFRVRDPGLGPAQDCYDVMEQESVGGSYGMWNDKYSLNKLMIRICRNLESHLLSLVYKYRRNGRSHYSDVDLIIMALFAEPLLSFAEQAQRNGVLRSLT